MAFHLWYENLQQNGPWRADQMLTIIIVFTKDKFAYHVTLFFPGVYNLHKHSIFFFYVNWTLRLIFSASPEKNECVPGRNDTLWIHLSTMCTFQASFL
mgnify:CR=1 FL=1